MNHNEIMLEINNIKSTIKLKLLLIADERVTAVCH